MQKILVVVDMQNDFIDGALGTKEAVAIVPNVKEKIESFDGKVIFTRDTHPESYLDSQEGRNLPVLQSLTTQTKQLVVWDTLPLKHKLGMVIPSRRAISNMVSPGRA